ncbi:hypothetical protein B0H19DRAFT_1161039 [Mycena capillaripes]|nr:hypothetical protein B0H19DRAFT_1161039 [Mycena capillaripes]
MHTFQWMLFAHSCRYLFPFALIFSSVCLNYMSIFFATPLLGRGRNVTSFPGEPSIIRDTYIVSSSSYSVVPNL